MGLVAHSLRPAHGKALSSHRYFEQWEVTLNLDSKAAVEIVAAITIPVSILAIITYRIYTKRGIGVRILQMLAIVTAFPMILILALEGVLEHSAVGALLGALVGYFFSNIGEYDRRGVEEA